MLSIPALRVGAIISSPEIIRCINNYKPHYTVNSLALLFGEAIIDNHNKVVGELKEKYECGRQYIMRELHKYGYVTVPSFGCFICIKPKNKPAEFVTEKLKEHGILILCGSGDLTGYLRLTIADVKYMKIFLDALLEIDK